MTNNTQNPVTGNGTGDDSENQNANSIIPSLHYFGSDDGTEEYYQHVVYQIQELWGGQNVDNISDEEILSCFGQDVLNTVRSKRS